MDEEKKEEEPYLVPQDDSFESDTMLEAEVGTVLESSISEKKEGLNSCESLFLLAFPREKNRIHIIE